MREARHPEASCKPRGPYSPAVIASGRLIFTASQGPLDPATGKEPPGGIQAEARQALSNIRAIVEGCGGSLAQRRQGAALPARHGRLRRGQRGLARVLPGAPPGPDDDPVEHRLLACRRRGGRPRRRLTAGGTSLCRRPAPGIPAAARVRSRALPRSVARSRTQGRPPTIVCTTVRSAMAAGSTAVGSPSRTTRSANLPASSVPTSSSTWHRNAASRV